MERYQFSNVSSATFFAGGRQDGGASAEKDAVTSGSADDIWADFDCVIEYSEQVKKEERMRELNRAYLAKGPSPTCSIDEDELNPAEKIGDGASVTEPKPIGHGYDSKIQKPEIQHIDKVEESAEETLACFQEGHTTEKSGSHQETSENTDITSADMGEEEQLSGEDVDNTRELPTSSTQKSCNINSLCGSLTDTATWNVESVESRVSSDEVHMVTQIREAWGIPEKEAERELYVGNEVRRKPSVTRLPTVSDVDKEESLIIDGTSSSDLLCNQVGSRIRVPVNTPVASFMAQRDNIESSRSLNRWMCGADNWYTSNIGQLMCDKEDGTHNDVECLYKQSFVQDQDPEGVLSRKLPRAPTPFVFKSSADYDSDTSLSSQSIESLHPPMSEITTSKPPQDGSYRIIRQLIDSSDEEEISDVRIRNHILTAKCKTQSASRKVLRESVKEDAAHCQSDDLGKTFDIEAKEFRKEKMRKKFEMAEDQEPQTAKPRGESRKYFIVVELTKTSVSHRFGRILRNVGRKIRSAFTMCTACCS